MNDFLQSLRNGQAEKQRTPKTRKNYDNSYHYTSPNRFQSGGYQNNRNQQMKHHPAPQQPGNQLPVDEVSLTSILADSIENLNSHIEALAKSQDYLIRVQEKTADMLERQAIAIERIVDHLDIAPAKSATLEKENALQKKFKHHYVTEKKIAPVITTPAKPEPVAPVEPVKPILRKRKKIIAKKSKAADLPSQKLLGRDAVMDIIHSMRAEGSTFDQVASRLIALGQPTFSGRGEWHAQTIHRLCNKK